MNHAEILREAGLVPEAVDVHSFAVQNVAESGVGMPDGEVVALLNAGAEVTNVSIVRDGTPLYTQDVSTGGNRLIQSIQRTFQIGRADATSALEHAHGYDVAPLIDEFCRELSAALDKSVSYLRSAGDAQELNRVLLAGGCTRIPGFIERMRAVQSNPIELIDPLERLKVAPDALPAGAPPEIGPQLAVAVGLALRKGRAE
jgi:type IV pilus assembly protein PilM